MTTVRRKDIYKSYIPIFDRKAMKLNGSLVEKDKIFNKIYTLSEQGNSIIRAKTGLGTTASKSGSIP